MHSSQPIIFLTYTVISLRLFDDAFLVEFKPQMDKDVRSGDDSDEDEKVRKKSSKVLCSCLGIP